MPENKAKSNAKRESRTSKPGKVAAKNKTGTKAGASAKPSSRRSKPVKLSDQQTSDLRDWREETLGRMRTLILEADPEIVEEQKWKRPSNAMQGIPVWSHNGIVCTGETYKKVVKLTFAKGASIPDPAHLFNSSLDGNTRRAIDIHEGETVAAGAFKALVKAAVAQNVQPAKKAKSGAKEAKPTKSPKSEKVVLLSGGNPQIAKGYGDAPVQAYIAAMPGWKSDLGRRLDALIARTVPNVYKAVKWNSPFYGIEGDGWFLSLHCFTKYIKVAFFRGALLRPVPPGQSKQKDVRYLDIYEDDSLDESQLADWVKQASQLPGVRM